MSHFEGRGFIIGGNWYKKIHLYTYTFSTNMWMFYVIRAFWAVCIPRVYFPRKMYEPVKRSSKWLVYSPFLMQRLNAQWPIIYKSYFSVTEIIFSNEFVKRKFDCQRKNCSHDNTETWNNYFLQMVTKWNFISFSFWPELFLPFGAH